MSLATVKKSNKRAKPGRKPGVKMGTYAVPGRPRASVKEIVRKVHHITQRLQEGIPLAALRNIHGLDERGWERWLEIYYEHYYGSRKASRN